MVLCENFATSDVATLGELEAFVDRIDPNDLDEIQKCAPILAAYNNSDVLQEVLTRQVDAIARGDAADFYSPQSFLLLENDRYFVRLNIWMPARNELSHELQGVENLLNSVDLPHDHNFHLMTVGHTGPGYTTTVWSYDYESVKGEIGESVALTPGGSYTLHPGTVLLYRESRDIHDQSAVEEVSSSINLCFRSRGVSYHRQYIFDTQASTIAGLVNTFVTGRASFLDLAYGIGDGGIRERIREAANKSPCSGVRGIAAQVMRQYAEAA